MPVSFWCAQAWLPPGRVAASVAIGVQADRITAVTEGIPYTGGERLDGLTLPGLVNAHSHAFHRTLRGRTQDADGSFWTWREQMYAVAGRLDPDSYRALATEVFTEMVLAGITTVGEFHYLHHGPGGIPYADPNAMGLALIEAAGLAGIRLTLLDTAYLHGGISQPLAGAQLRFGDASIEAWATRVAALPESDTVRIGAGAHSVRALTPDELASFAQTARGRLHVHLSEQPAENEACLAAYGHTPAEILDTAGVLGPRSTVVHATHLTPGDIARLGGSGTGVCLCPSTEQDLADGIGPGRALADAGSPLCLGSDSHAVIDLFAEARGVEMHERLARRRRGCFTPAELLGAATRATSLGWDAGALAPGMLADLVSIRLDSVRTRGCDPGQLIFAATAADVTTVVAAGRVVVRGGEHTG